MLGVSVSMAGDYGCYCGVFFVGKAITESLLQLLTVVSLFDPRSFVLSLLLPYFNLRSE